MKALYILKEEKEELQCTLSSGYLSHFGKQKLLKVNEAISELEALQQHIKELELQLTDAHSYFDGVHTVNGAKQ